MHIKANLPTSFLLAFLVDFNLYIRANLAMNMASDEREVAFYSILMPMLKKVGFVLSKSRPQHICLLV